MLTAPFPFLFFPLIVFFHLLSFLASDQRSYALILILFKFIFHNFNIITNPYSDVKIFSSSSYVSTLLMASLSLAAP